MLISVGPRSVVAIAVFMNIEATIGDLTLSFVELKMSAMRTLKVFVITIADS
jgi:hypothetical protein